MTGVFMLAMSEEEVLAAMQKADEEARPHDSTVDQSSLRAILRHMEVVGHTNITGVTIAVRYRDPADPQGSAKFASAVLGHGESVMYCLLAQSLTMSQQADAAEVPPSKSQVH